MRKKKFSKEEVDTIYENFLVDCIEKIDFKATFEAEAGSRQIKIACKGGEEIDSIPSSLAYQAASRAVLFAAKELSDRLEAKAVALLDGERKMDELEYLMQITVDVPWKMHDVVQALSDKTLSLDEYMTAMSELNFLSGLIFSIRATVKSMEDGCVKDTANKLLDRWTDQRYYLEKRLSETAIKEVE